MNGITLYIAEKPSMARDLAQVLGAKKREGIKYVGQQVWVSWCIGHLVEIANPDQHDPRWKSWRLDVLPILPPKILWQAKHKTKSHFKELAKLIQSSQVKHIVNACDAGREGELIFRTVYQVAGGCKPTSRFWVSSLTNEAIQKGLKHLRPSHEFNALAAAAYCRAEADWLVGMNATRALTARASDLLSLGRVQTPTLNMIVKRQQEIDQFKPEVYYVLDLLVQSEHGAEWVARWFKKTHSSAQTNSLVQTNSPAITNEPNQQSEQPRSHWLKSPEEAQKLIEKVKGVIGAVSRAEGKENLIPPPLLYHLTALQQECNRRFSFTADHTLKIAQSLYETHKLISYPRTDSRHLTPDVARSIPQIIQGLTQPYAQLAQSCTLKPSQLNKRYVNAQKVTDHHAIIPTHRSADLPKLNADESRVYDLVVRSLLCALSSPAKDQQATLECIIANEHFIAKGTIELEAGWRALAPPKKQKKSDQEQTVQLPFVPVGTRVRAQDAQILEKRTQAPKHYTDASLLGSMEHAGKQIDDEALRAIMRGGGLGTPATRANIIATLLRRNYIKRAQKNLIPTEAGQVLIASINDPALLEPQLTAEWEQRLQAISEGEADSNPFMTEIRSWVSELVTRLPQGPRVLVPNGKGDSKSSKTLSSTRYKQHNHNHSKVEENKGSWRKQQGSKKTSDKVKRPSSTELSEVIGQSCPQCKKGQLIQGQAAWGCNRWREHCRFIIPFELNGVPIPKEEAARVCARRQSRLFHEAEGKKYRLELNQNGSLKWVESKPRSSKRTTQKKGQKGSSSQSSWRSKAGTSKTAQQTSGKKTSTWSKK